MAIEKARITPGMLTALMTSIYSSVIGYHISTMAEIARQDAWISVFGAALIAFAALLLGYAVAPAQGRDGMAVRIESLLGRAAGRLVNIALLLYFLLVLAVVLQHVLGVVNLAVLTDTPVGAVLILFSIPVALGARLGIEVLGRLAILYGGIIVFSFFVMGGALIQAVEIAQLAPVFEAGGKILVASLAPGAILCQIFAVWWFQPYVGDRKVVLKSGATALSIATAFLLMLVVYSEGVFGYREVHRMLLPSLRLARAIQLGGISERLDAWLVSVWMLGAYTHAALFAYLASQQLAWVTGSRQFRAFAPAVVAVGASIALAVAPNLPYFSAFLTLGGFIPWSYLHTLGLGLLLACSRLLQYVRRRPAPNTTEEGTT